MRRITSVCLFTLGVSIAAQDAAAPRIDSIKKDDLRADLFFLAGDGMRGRLTNTPENALAADWIKARFERLGLKPAGSNGSYYQPYLLMTATIGAENQIEINGASRRRAGQDFYPLRFSSSGGITGDVVFAGFGITSPERKYDDYAGGAVKGKVALVIDHEPGERDANSPFDGVVTAQAASPLLKALAAQEHGAIGILFVDDVHNHPGETNFEAAARNYWPERAPRIESFTLAAWMEKVRIPAAQISPALAAQILAGSGRALDELSRASETGRGITPVALGDARVALTTSVDRHVIPDRNVLAALEGSDPKLKDEWVIVCAHIDHNGADGNDVFNGADDDGSGIVGLLEIAEAWALAAADGRRPRRSVLFAAWNSEERGLLGAWAYTERPTAPLERIVAVLNMDMIGRDEEVPVGGGARFRGLDLQTAESNRNAANVIGTTRSPALKTAIERANRAIGLELKFRYDNNASNLMRRSDHWPFLQRGVPGVWFHTGLHPDYHTVYDRPEKINYEKMEKVAKLVYQTSWDLAVGEQRPRLETSSSTKLEVRRLK
ncbi:MAG: M28 family peptidase [Vicinamibacterales bacterium]